MRAVCALWMLATPLHASAATLLVPGDYSDVASAVAVAVDGDIIEVASGYDGRDNAQVILDDLTIEIRGGGPDLTGLPPLRVDRDSILTVADAELGCSNGPGLTLWSFSAVATVDNVRFEACVGHPGIDALSGAALTVRNSHFSSNSSEQGAGILSDDTRVTVESSLFEDLSVTGGGTSDTCAQQGCGAGIKQASGELTIVDSIFRRGSASRGGAVYMGGGTLTISGTRFEQWQADEGGALWAASADTTVSDSVFTLTNSAAGGAVMLATSSSADTATLTGNLFVDNTGTNAALAVSGTGSTAVTRSHFCGNSGTSTASDIEVGLGPLTVRGTSFALNTGATSVLLGGGDSLVENVSFAGTQAGALEYSSGTGTHSVVNTLFLDPGARPLGGVSGATVSGRYSHLFGLSSWSTGVSASFASSTVGDDPLVVDYVSRSQTNCDTLNLWLTADSPLRDAGDPSIDDLDGSRSDIGAYGGLGADLVDADGDNSFNDLDCNEADDTIGWGLTETPYDGIDQDCDGTDLTDVDGDGYDGVNANGTDCDDSNASVNPGEAEVPYNGLDDDCADGDLTDVDGDGYDGLAAGGTDCDDDPSDDVTGDPTAAQVNPGATDTCYDGVDQDCDLVDDYDCDADGSVSDAYGGDDCDDTDPDMSPLEPEVWYDGEDSNCDGADDYDQDGDGQRSDEWTGDDCDDEDPTRYEGADEVPYDGIDQDCDGADLIDVDGDGFIASSVGGDDCDDNNADVYPGAPEDPGPDDLDCDGFTDASSPITPRAGCGCTTTRAPAFPLWCIPFLLALRRRTPRTR